MYRRRHSYPYEHREEVNSQLDHLIYEHDQLQKQVQSQTINDISRPLTAQINQWEQDSINRVRASAEQARNKVAQLIDENRQHITRRLRVVSDEVKIKKMVYVELDLERWNQEIEKLKKEVNMIPTLLTDTNSIKVIPAISSTSSLFFTDTLVRTEKFDKVYGPAKIEQWGSIAEQQSLDQFSHVRGSQLYSTGVHRIQLKIEKMLNNAWHFFGIISSETPIDQTINSTGEYGWGYGYNQVWLKGVQHKGYGGYDSDMREGDQIELVINCDAKRIELHNKRIQHKHYDIPIDVKTCPLPWQLNVGLYYVGDRVRII
ncbi:unnamed protein product [Didymodactylos carnosus]|uniref:B30.2/SPRY domain-containing protein n=1 Tax=Didymodactylos carnosus TaxID=1234261 RepID=A0A814GS26_9BILA|nr:unnamed protein product [Didymodactylos carnosus]CAF1000075.1 unnamed protein product [Didymodactylos carnosus]CAF3740821.1 unnamed protein product [Didymodactylos carnosus]CAF3771552.1 unnamed protein product [Didymodactylos carnosus]